ncbi:MAG: NAD-glutamate dehydrogenase [Gammaproteobacteria bacterium]|nr:NAD-glutamate dehydrogenase [Gammaproteobacteria bacterium]
MAAKGSRLKAAPELPVDRKRFLKLYYAQVAPEDLSEDPAALAAAALDHVAWAGTRRRGTAKIRAFNPTVEHNGWTSRHTIVEMVNDDMPFLVDSVTMTLDTLGHSIHITIHPMLRIERDGRGVLTGLGGGREESPRARTESFIHIEISRQTDPKVLRRIETELAATLRDVRIAVADWQAMLARLREATDELREADGPPPDLQQESCEFLEWLADDHFTLLGYREYELERGRSEDVLRIIEGTGLGILRERGKLPEPSILTGPARAEARSKQPLVITKANTRSRVHRPALLDYVSVKVFDERGRPYRERRFLGLFTSSAYNEMPRDIPLLRLKAARLLELADVEPRSHRGKMLQHIVDTFPRDDLFQASLDDLVRISNGILALQERRRIRLFCRRDPFGRFYSCLVYLPRDQYSGRARRRIEQILLDGLRGTSVEAAVTMTESALARLSVNVRTDPEAPVLRNMGRLESQIEAAIVGWQDRLRAELLERLPEDEALALYNRFADRFSAGYREEVSPERASEDLSKVARVADGASRLEMAMFQPEGPGRRLRFSTFSPDRLPLYVALQILENMGLKVLGEQVYSARPEGGEVWIQEFDVELHTDQPVDATAVADRFMECFERVLRGEADNDGFNSFVVLAGIGWRDALVLRAYGKYLAQTGMRFSLAYVQEVLARYPLLASTLVARFRALFDPELSVEERAAADARHEKVLKAELGRISNLDEDRILRAFAAAVNATLRTNFFRTGGDGEPKPYLSFKLDSAKVADLPKPRPMFEAFVYSQRVEGVHLRMSRVARGGIRWSDRREDFRTEVLGLMKAQQVKNTVIVPNGAKGGFVCKRLPVGDREAQQREVVGCYETFIRGLLDVTDNIVDDRVVKPPQVVTRDPDDPYLVVAADKGTATFSDIANGLAAEYDFWLGDAFASGGSAGYDHKEMGITARGAWESVKRHFREMGRDTQKEPFTVVGIGDMSGDVFGNGMLRSTEIRLIAAFDHRHIFVDPDPDPAVSFEERRRLFELPRSTWEDYDRKKLSKGGGVYSRQSKAIKLHAAARARLGIDTDTVTPPELIRAVLAADVDLLWNGGIGTYVKASDESNQSAGDPTNDAVRVSGKDLKCRVVGEGGNLGFTQLGRIEYALRGGRINTDFIDNSGGVDSSDREVNIKILLNGAMKRGELTRPRRNRLLASMTDEVADLVLQNNYGQTQALSMMSARSLERLGEHQRLIRVLEAQNLLDRAVEFLPSDEQIEERRKAGRGLTRPELAVVLSYSKIQLTASLVDSDIPDDAYCSKELELYFPKVLQQRFEPLIQTHRLRREIIAMLISGSMINRMGPFFVLRARDEVGASSAQVARAYSIVREVFGLRSLWRSIEALDYQVPAEMQYSTVFQISRMARRAVYWFLQRYPSSLDIVPTIERFRPGVARVQESLAKVLSGGAEQRFDADLARFDEAGLPRSIAKQIASLTVMTQLLEIVKLANDRGIDPSDVARAHFELGAKLRLDWIRDRIEALDVDNYWQALARGQLLETLTREHRDVLSSIVAGAGGGDLKAAVDTWLATTSDGIARVQNVIDDMRGTGVADFATLSVALREVERLRRV